jgi:nucleotide-binding universal stress UspA family protein
MEIKRILVPHDGNQTSDKAVLYASNLAKALDAEINLLYIIDEIEIPGTLLLENDRVSIERARRSIQRDLEQNWNRFAQEKVKSLWTEKIRASSEIRSGDVAEQILRFAKENQADLIVMGSRKLEGVSQIVVALGSVARKVSERAFCPVMLVH